MTNILISDGLAKEGQEILKSAGIFNIDFRKGVETEELKKLLPTVDAIVIRSATKMTKDLIDLSSKMKLIVRAGEGVDNVDVEHATQKKIHVMNTPGANNLAVAELALGMMFSLARNIPWADATTKAGRWEKNALTGGEIYGKTLGIIGMGKIGKLVAERAKALGMKITGYDPLIHAGSKATNFDETVASVEDLAARSDFITIHVPKNKNTLGMINKTVLDRCKPGTYFINTSRGGVAVEADLLAALEAGKLAGIATDVFETEPVKEGHPLATHPKVICTPHVGAATREAQLRVALMAAQQLVDYFKDGKKVHVLNEGKF